MRRQLFLLSALTLASTGAAQAKPPYRKALTDHYGPLLARNLDQCGTCHAEKDEPQFNATLANPHNAFGARLFAVAAELVKKRKPTDITTRLEAIGGEDSDRDGAANLAELLTGHQPGSAKDRPTAGELAALPKLKGELARFRVSHPWKPFEPVRRPAVPVVKNRKWVRNPIDAFVLAEQEARGLKPRPEAPKAVLLRRVYLDLIGLPPTREELNAFLQDRSPNAYEKVVDRLLGSPRYGERWGRHWMDVWRYSDWDGYGEEVRNSQRHIWRWRDWIIGSLNEDKGYDRMVQEMLAGDELAPNDPKVLPATGFLVRNWYVFSKHEMLNKVVEGTSKAFLGLTVNCARCHDHKYDPVSQKEYYQFRAFFEPVDVRTDRVPGQLDPVKDGLPRIFDADPKATTFLFIRGDDRKPDKDQPAAPALPAALGGAPLRIEPVPLPLVARVPEKQPHVIADLLAAAEREATSATGKAAQAKEVLAKAEQALSVQTGAATPAAQKAVADARLQAEQTELAAAVAATKAVSLAAVIRAEQLEDAGKKDSPEWQQAAQAAVNAQRTQTVMEARLARFTAEREVAAAAGKAAAVVEAARKKATEAVQALVKAEEATRQPAGTAYTPRPVKSYPETSSGRRLALARWIADRQNPLTARVAVNHVWLRHFGRALVPTVTDFGVNGQRPTHPALLDWLAATFASGESGANVDLADPSKSKSTSKSRTAAAERPTPNTQHRTPTTPWSFKALHRLILTSSTYRMDSTFDPANEAVDPENRYLWRMNARRMEAEVVRDSILSAAGQLDVSMGGPDLDPNLGLSSKRRSVYFRHSMEKQVEFLNTFDQVPPAECYERPETVMPQQALALANSALSVAQSRVLATALWKKIGEQPAPSPEAAFLNLAFEQLLGRLPTAAERTECGRFLAAQAALLADPKQLTPFATGGPNAVAPAADPQQRARESLIHVLLNHNEFVTIR